MTEILAKNRSRFQSRELLIGQVMLLELEDTISKLHYAPVTIHKLTVRIPSS